MAGEVAVQRASERGAELAAEARERTARLQATEQTHLQIARRATEEHAELLLRLRQNEIELSLGQRNARRLRDRARRVTRATWRNRRQRYTQLVAAAVVGGAVAIPTGVLGDIPPQSTSRALVATALPPAALRAGSAFSQRDIPAAYKKLYVAAAQRYGLDWSILAAMGKIESDHGRSPEAGVQSGTNNAGAAGPMQFLSDTWQRFGQSVDAQGVRDVYDPADAINSMGGYLRASGAPDDWSRALFAYNHSTRYVREVLDLAARYRASRR